jgi:hypothetical protein
VTLAGDVTAELAVVVQWFDGSTRCVLEVTSNGPEGSGSGECVEPLSGVLALHGDDGPEVGHTILAGTAGETCSRVGAKSIDAELLKPSGWSFTVWVVRIPPGYRPPSVIVFDDGERVELPTPFWVA